MLLLLVFVAIALGVSFLCSVLEAVLLSVSPSYIAVEQEHKRESRRRNGRVWRAYKHDIDRPLAAILSLNTIAHTVGAAGAGAQAGVVFGEAWFGVISAVLTLLILVVSEIIPKTLGALYWRQLAPLCAPVLRVVVWSMYPLVLMAKGITRLLSRGKAPRSINREEFVALAELGVREGIFDAEESAAIASVVRFRALVARDVMTPRPVIFSLPEDAAVQDVVDGEEAIRFSRIPLYREQADHIVGFIRKDELMLARARRPEARLADLRRELLTVADRQPVSDLLRQMVESRSQIALVVDEYGALQGLLTVEDLVETLIGMEIVDETDGATDMQVFARDLWRRRAERLGLTDALEENIPPL